jgi:sec-independent protein translocase protein TatB
VLLLILESLGSTELLFILIMALVFFGPRKLPQISRSLGRSLAEFRRASDDFKRTWEREVALENPLADTPNQRPSLEENGLLADESSVDSVNEYPLEALPSEDAIPRERRTIMEDPSHTETETKTSTASEPQQKRDWL